MPLTPSHGYTIFCNLQVIYLFIYLIWPHQNTDIHWTSTSALEVPSTRHVTIGDRSFGVAAARVWNTLPADVTSSSSLPVFKRHLKNFLIHKLSRVTLSLTV